MRRTTQKRGLYRHEAVEPESDAEFRDVADKLASAPDDYITMIEQHARDILTEAGIDLETLWEVDHARGTVRFALVKRAYEDKAELTPDEDQQYRALDLLQHIRYCVRPALQENGGILSTGIRLAEQWEHLKANRAWRQPVESYVRSRRKSQHRDVVQATAARFEAEGVHPRRIASKTAGELQCRGYKISDRQVRALLRGR